MKKIIITPGEPAGIGPDLIIMLAQKKWPIELVICADPDVLINRAKQLHLPIRLYPYLSYNKPILRSSGEITILTCNTAETVIPGKLNKNNSKYVLQTLTRACEGCINKEFEALITGPVNKAILNDAGIKFNGHTEFFAKYTKTKKVVMMLTNNKINIALATTHIPISQISKNITQKLLYETIIVLNNSLKKYFNIVTPKIFVCGLNPHSGECGYIGNEEITIITPTLNILRNKGYNLIGPLPADTIFQKKYLKNADVILTMYHDQGLPVLKYQSLGESINVTFGLPFIRTSVDHGTAIELAGSKTLIKKKSMIMAINFAIKMSNKLHEKNIL